MRIAITQTSITSDPAVNGETTRAVMGRAAQHGARLVQFPEGALSGYAKEQIQSWADVDWDAVGTEIDAVVALAGELGIWVVGCDSASPSVSR